MNGMFDHVGETLVVFAALVAFVALLTGAGIASLIWWLA